MGDLVIKPLGPDTVDDFLAFFDGIAFADNPHWAGCFCNFFHNPREDSVPDPGTPEHRAYSDTNRREKIAAIRSGRAQGYLAYLDGSPVGWLNAAPRESYENPRAFSAARDGTPGVGAVMCFIVAPGHRGKGVASALLGAAGEGFRALGLRHAEGYARRDDAPRPEWSSYEMSSYHGPRAMYDAAGFTEVGRLGSFAIMRKAL